MRALLVLAALVMACGPAKTTAPTSFGDAEKRTLWSPRGQAVELVGQAGGATFGALTYKKLGPTRYGHDELRDPDADCLSWGYERRRHELALTPTGATLTVTEWPCEGAATVTRTAPWTTERPAARCQPESYDMAHVEDELWEIQIRDDCSLALQVGFHDAHELVLDWVAPGRWQGQELQLTHPPHDRAATLVWNTGAPTAALEAYTELWYGDEESAEDCDEECDRDCTPSCYDDTPDDDRVDDGSDDCYDACMDQCVEGCVTTWDDLTVSHEGEQPTGTYRLVED